jgi:hypothetical protein
MERLTYRTELGVRIDKNEDCPSCNICWNCNIPPRECKYISDALKKLADYEDLEEQGRLVKLPCKVGDAVYVIVGKNISVQKIQRAKIDSEMKIEFCTKRRGFALFDIGKTVFLTKSEAEAKLKELRGGENGSME